MTRAAVEAEICEMLCELRRPAPDFRFDTRPRGDATPHVEGDGPTFDWIVSERGQEYQRETVDADELLFVTMRMFTRGFACDAELRTRHVDNRAWVRKLRTLWMRHGPASFTPAILAHADTYSRKTWMAGHARLMDHLRPHWGARIADEYAQVLRRAPLTAHEHLHARDLDLRQFGLS